MSDLRNRFGQLGMEALGAFMLVSTISISATTAPAAAPIAVGVILAAMIYAGGHVSGAHYNPALTLALFLRGGIALADVLLYMAAQLAGAVLGGLVGGLITGHTVAPKMGPTSNHLQAFLAEAVFTGALAFVFLSTTSSEASKGNPYFGAAIASVVTVAGYTVAGVSGAVLNPAVGAGLVLTHNWLKVGYLIWLVAAQLVGAAGGVGAFWFVAPSDFAEVSEEARNVFETARLRAREGASEARGLLPHRGEAGPSQG